MICLRCGYCCHRYAVIIVDNPEFGIREDNLTAHLGDGRCKHLRGFKVGEYFCRLHHYDWYKETPCASYGQVETGNTECRMGRSIIDRFKNGDSIPFGRSLSD